MRPISVGVKKRLTNRTRKTKIARRGLAQRRGESGTYRTFVTRNKALKLLQVPLKDFRRLCILKGIYPRDPTKKVHGGNKTYYYAKDIAYLQHEPVLAKFRENKAFMRKVAKKIGRRETQDAKRLWEEDKPKYTLDHLVRERYPSFIDALRDMDDALCMIGLFAALPIGNRIPAGRAGNCARLMREFACYIARSHSLRKCFLSVKGVYFQAEIMGQTITWLTPYGFAQELVDDVDYRVMLTFLEFYETAIRFVNFKLFHDLGLAYPPRVKDEGDDSSAGFIEALDLDSKDASASVASSSSSSAAAASSSKTKMSKQALRKIQGVVSKVAEDGESDSNDDDDDDDEEGNGAAVIDDDFKDTDEVKELHRKNREENIYALLFSECVMFFSREVPRTAIELVARSFGATVGWDGAGSPFGADDKRITHHVTDRDGKHLGELVKGRTYVQPQWVVDSANELVLLPAADYAPGATLPPHLSPFVDDKEIGYTPDQRRRLDAIKEKLRDGSLIDPDATLKEAIGSDYYSTDDEEGDASGMSEDEDGADDDSDNEDDDGEDSDSDDDNKASKKESQKNNKTKTKKSASKKGNDDESDDDEDSAEKAYRAEIAAERKGADPEAARKKALSAARKAKKRAREAEERDEEEMATVMMSKKDRRLYGRIAHSKAAKADVVKNLEEKRKKAKAERKKQRV